jgi:oxaloacetate decarboxylase gamma subunit
MFAGMGIVFLFLALLVVLINIMSALVLRYFPEIPSQKKTVPGITADIDKSIIAAITAAVHMYRNDRMDAGDRATLGAVAEKHN